MAKTTDFGGLSNAIYGIADGIWTFSSMVKNGWRDARNMRGDNLISTYGGKGAESYRFGATVSVLTLPLGAIGAEGSVAAKEVTQAEYTFTKSAGKHLNEMNLTGENAGMLKRPYMRSPMTIKNIMSTGEGTTDATFKGGMNWKVPGTFRGSQGSFELGINPKTNVIYHFNFVK